MGIVLILKIKRACSERYRSRPFLLKEKAPLLPYKSGAELNRQQLLHQHVKMPQENQSVCYGQHQNGEGDEDIEWDYCSDDHQKFASSFSNRSQTLEKLDRRFLQRYPVLFRMFVRHN